MKETLNSLMEVINTMESKLNAIDGYYQKMIEDHEFFINFCINKGKEYGKELENIQNYLTEIGAQVKGSRDLYEGQGDDVERVTFTATYEKYDITQNTTTEEKDEQNQTGVIIGAISGAVVGGIAGGFIGSAAGPVGMVAGGMFGAAVGAAVGADLGGMVSDMFGCSHNKKEYKTTTTTYTKTTGTITLTGADYYDGDKHSKALDQIVIGLQGEFATYLEKLKNRQAEAESQKEEADGFKQSIVDIKEKICTFKETADEMIGSLDEDKFDRDEIKKQCEILFVDVNLLMDALKQKSKKPEQNWE